jgi:signal transduction histidine kinase
MRTFTSVRFRLTAIYSLLLFGLAALVVGGVYTGLARDLDDEPVSRTYEVQLVSPEGIPIRQETVRAEFQSFEHLVNQSALDQLRSYSFFALGLLFLASLGVGWVVAGRVLRPIGWITGVAREIQATDLTRRIGLGGPKDELRDLADTFDDMLGRLESAFDAQRSLIQDASHELRNPLAVMRTNLDVVLSDPDATVDDLRHTATVVRRTTERMSRLVDDLLSYARQGLPDQAWERVGLAAVISETADEFRASAEARHLRIETSVTRDLEAMADRTALKQALANLAGNAVRLAPDGSTITLACGLAGGWAYVSVADEGPGIAPKDHEAVFERFWRADGQLEPGTERRTGLGLTIVRQIAERHGGSVALASTEGGGSTFVIWLPPI